MYQEMRLEAGSGGRKGTGVRYAAAAGSGEGTE